MKVSIVISMYNRGREVLETIDYLLFPSLLSNGDNDTELILLDDGSPLKEETEALMAKYLPLLREKFGRVLYRRSEKNLGFAKSYNRGLSLATGNKVIIANDDLYFPRESIKRLVKTLDEAEGYVIAGPITNANTSWSFQYCKQAPRVVDYTLVEKEKLELFAKWLGERMDGKRIQTENLCGFCFVARTNALKKIGGFDEGYRHAYYEDTDLIQRIAKKFGEKKIAICMDVFVGHGGIRGTSRSVLQRPIRGAYALLINGFRYANTWGYGKWFKRLVYGTLSQLTGRGTVSELLPKQINI